MATTSSGDYMISSYDSAQVAFFDGFLKVTDSKSSTVTSRPTETGYDYQDAVHNQARILNISIVVSDTSQTLTDTRSYVSIINSITGADTYVQEQLDIIEFFQDNRYKVCFKTKYKFYEDYLITNISYDEDENQALIINFNLVEVRDGTVDTTSTVTAGNYS